MAGANPFMSLHYEAVYLLATTLSEKHSIWSHYSNRASPFVPGKSPAMSFKQKSPHCSAKLVFSYIFPANKLNEIIFVKVGQEAGCFVHPDDRVLGLH